MKRDANKPNVSAAESLGNEKFFMFYPMGKVDEPAQPAHDAASVTSENHESFNEYASVGTVGAVSAEPEAIEVRDVF